MTRREKERNKGLKEGHGTVNKLHLYNSFENNWRHSANSMGLKTDWLFGMNTII